jgi:acyl-CoA synthetase (AMP-forming)/AMP-acid ligase II
MPLDTFIDIPKLDRLSDYVFHWSAADADGPAMALAGNPKIWTHGEYADSVSAYAKALIAAGVLPGDRVAVISAPNPQFSILFFAIISIGGIFVGLNPKYQRGELTHVVTDSSPKLLFGYHEIGGRNYFGDVAALCEAVPSIAKAIMLDDPSSRDAFLAAGASVSHAQRSRAQAEVKPRDACAIVYTSGSTGTPKGAVLHHSGTVETALAQLHSGMPRPTRTQNYFPINHVGCLFDIMGTTVVAGGFTVYLESFDPAASLALIDQYRLTLWGGVPTVFQLCLAHPSFNRTKLSSVELIFWGGATCARPVIEALAKIRPNLATNYGMTEVVGAVTLMKPTSDIDTLANSVGFPSPAFEVRRQHDDGTVPTDDEPAEIQARGSAVLLEYWNRPDATAAAFTPDGFYKTGDLATLNADGSYKIVGRVSEMFKSGGYNVYPREVELALEKHPAVAMAAVVGICDALYDEVGYACVMPQAEVSAEELRNHCRAILANYKVPKHFEITTNPPLLPIGKIDKRALKQRQLNVVEG